MLRDIQQVLALIRAGKPIILLDDRREYEGDLFIPAEVVVPEVLQFMVRKGSGLLCMAMPRTYLEDKGIPRLSELFTHLDLTSPEAVIQKFWKSISTRPADTPFHVPVDFRGCAGGISVLERYKTIKTLLDGATTIDDFEVPGHLFTLGSHAEGLRGRVGHTETTVELCVMAGLKPAGLLCELVSDEGEMRRGEDLDAFARNHDLDIVPVSAVVEAALRQPAGVK